MNLLYQSLEHYIDHDVIRSETPRAIDLADYLPCGLPPGAARPPDNLGPVERQILSFFDDPSGGARHAVLRGQVGSGKTTTLHYLQTYFLSDSSYSHQLDLDNRLIINIDYNPKLRPYPSPDKTSLAQMSATQQEAMMEAGASATSWYASFISTVRDRLGRYWTKYCTPDDEYVKMWDWALGASCDPDIWPAAEILGANREEIQQCAIGAVSILEARQTFLTQLWKQWDDQERLTYLALKTSYLVYARFAGRASAVCVILDNIDPFPATAHDQLIDACFRFSEIGHCRALVSSRPTTLLNSRHKEPGAYRVHTVIEHRGPQVSDVLADRIQRYGLNLSNNELRIRLERAFKDTSSAHSASENLEDRDHIIRDSSPHVHDVIREFGGGEYVIFDGYRVSFAVVRRWLEYLLMLLTDAGESGAAHVGTFAYMLNNLSGGSIRFGKLVFEAFCASDHVKWAEVLGYEQHSKAQGTTYCELQEPKSAEVVRDRRMLRALVCGTSASVPTHTRSYVCNMFHTAAHYRAAPLLKMRILDYLLKRDLPIKVAQLWSWLARFGYSDEIVRLSLNGLKHERRRLVDIDCWVDFDGDSIMGYQHVSVVVGPAGRFYRSHAVYNIDYVQECLPTSDVSRALQQVSDHGLVSRMRYLRLGLIEIAKYDAQDVKILIMKGGLDAYKDIYVNKFIISELMASLRSSVIAILQSRVINYAGSAAEGRQEEKAELANWVEYAPRELDRIYRSCSRFFKD